MYVFFLFGALIEYEAVLVKDFDVVYPSDASTFDLFAFIVPVKVLLTLRACDNDSVTPFPPLPLTPVFQL